LLTVSFIFSGSLSSHFMPLVETGVCVCFFIALLAI
jgi:hypothetical protein